MSMFINSLYLWQHNIYSTLYFDLKVNLNGDAFCVDKYYDQLHLQVYFTVRDTI